MNWYKKAKKDPIKKPYKIVATRYGLEQTPQQLENVFENAYSSNQARLLFLQKYPFLKDFYQLGYEIEARFDQEEFKKQEIERQRIKNVQDMDKKREQKQIEEGWWNQ